MLDPIRKNAQSWLVKLVFGLIILVFVFWGVGTFTADKASVVGYVNEIPVTVVQFRDAYQRSLEQVQQRFPEVNEDLIRQLNLRAQVFNQLADAILVQQRAREMGLFVADEEVRRAVLSVPVFKNDAGNFDREIYRAVLAANGLTPSQFEADFRSQLLMDKLREYVGLPVGVTTEEAWDLFAYAREQATVDYLLFPVMDHTAKVEISDEDVASFYENNQDRFRTPRRVRLDYLLFTPEAMADRDAVTDEEIQAFYEADPDRFTRPEEIRARHILIRAEENATAEETETALAKITDVRKQILGKKLDFEEAARRFSEGPTAPRGGDLGWFSRGRMVESFEETAFALTPGTVSKPVRSPFGYHLIQVEEKRPAGVITLEEARDEIRSEIAVERAGARLADALDEGVSMLLGDISLEETAEALNMAVRSTGLFAKTAPPPNLNLKPESAEAIFALEEGGVTPAPLAVEDGYLLGRATQVEPAAVKPLKEVRGEIVQTLTRQRAKDLAMQAAGKALESLKADAEASLPGELRSSEPFGRQGFIPTLGSHPELASKAFAAETGAWLNQVFEASQGAFIARLDERIPPDQAEWEAQQEMWSATLAENKQQELFQDFMSQMRQQATIEIVNPEYLQ